MDWFIGIDLGGTQCAAGIVDAAGQILARDTIRTGAERPPQVILAAIAEQVGRLVSSLGADRSHVRAIGMGAPGTPDNHFGYYVYSSNLPFRPDTPIRKALEAGAGVPVHLANDAACAALAEARAGGARGVDSAVTLTLGTGIGCGLVLQGRMYRGFNQAAGEFGHSVLVPNGVACPCGRKGCFEQYASATALIRETRRAMAREPQSLLHRTAREQGEVDARTAFLAARAGDSAASRIVEDYLRLLSEGVTNLVNTLMPDVLLLGGGVANEGASLLSAVRAFVDAHAYYGEGVAHTRIGLAQLGNDAGIIGAALMAADELNG